MSFTPKVTIVILNYNNWENTIECLHSLLNLEYSNFEIVVVDNCSPNNSLSKLTDFVTDLKSSRKTNVSVQIVGSSNNGGYAAGNNIGIKIGLENKADYVLVLNNDTLASQSFLKILIEFAEKSEKDSFLFGPKIIDLEQNKMYGARKRIYKDLDYFFVPPNFLYHLFPRNSRWLDIQCSDQLPFTRSFEVKVLSGSCILFKADFFREVGLLDEGTFLYMEEMIIACRASQKGIRSFFVPDAIVYHSGGKSTGQVSQVKIIRHFISSCQYFMKNYQSYSLFKRHVLLSGVYLFKFLVSVKSQLRRK